jgi:hypothetical protein
VTLGMVVWAPDTVLPLGKVPPEVMEATDPPNPAERVVSKV